MNEVVKANQSLPFLVNKAASTLASAASSAEVLEAKDLASAAYNAAKSAGRMKAVKDAHDDLLVKVYRAQADALIIESQAKVRLADEYDVAQERGEVASNGRRKTVENDNGFPPTASDLGLRRYEIHEARQVRDAVKEKPDILEKTTDELIDQGLEPTKAKMREAILHVLHSDDRQKINPRIEQVRDPSIDRFFLFLDCCEKIADFDIDFILNFQKFKPSREKLKGLIPTTIATLQAIKGEIK